MNGCTKLVDIGAEVSISSFDWVTEVAVSVLKATRIGTVLPDVFGTEESKVQLKSSPKPTRYTKSAIPTLLSRRTFVLVNAAAVSVIFV